MVKPVAGYRPLAYSSPEAVQTTGTVAVVHTSEPFYPFVRIVMVSALADAGDLDICGHDEFPFLRADSAGKRMENRLDFRREKPDIGAHYSPARRRFNGCGSNGSRGREPRLFPFL